jgi:uncharacterized protein YaaR (DUF327 family)
LEATKETEQTTISLNDKFDATLDVLEATFKENEKHIPYLYRSAYKPLISTIRKLLLMKSVNEIDNYKERFMIFVEAIFDAEYSTKEEFKNALKELINARSKN